MNKINIFNDLKIFVVGAGPAGLSFARKAQLDGASVTVVEQYGDPRGSNAGFTDRSFNLTLNNAGRNALGDPAVWRSGSKVVGRAIHNVRYGDEPRYASYGDGDSALLTSIPRPTLRQNLIRFAEKAGVIIRFETKVIDIDPEAGVLTIQPGNRSSKTLEADLIVIADGLHSLGNKIITNSLGGSLNLHPEPYNYVTTVLDKDVCKGLSLEHIHFWHQIERDALSIGVPNKDGSIAVLMISRFSDIDDKESPFADFQKSLLRMSNDFPQLLALDPMLPERLIGRLRGRFYYKAITNYVLGARCVIVGDAGNTIPPWAAFGANAALYSADALVRFLSGCQGNLVPALKSYEQHMLILSNLIIDYVDHHGKFLMKEVIDRPDEGSSSPMLGQLINQAVQKTDIPNGVTLLSF